MYEVGPTTERRIHEHVREAVIIEVPRAADRHAGPVAIGFALDHEAAVPLHDLLEIHPRRCDVDRHARGVGPVIGGRDRVAERVGAPEVRRRQVLERSVRIDVDRTPADADGVCRVDDDALAVRPAVVAQQARLGVDDQRIVRLQRVVDVVLCLRQRALRRRGLGGTCVLRGRRRARVRVFGGRRLCRRIGARCRRRRRLCRTGVGGRLRRARERQRQGERDRRTRRGGHPNTPCRRHARG